MIELKPETEAKIRKLQARLGLPDADTVVRLALEALEEKLSKSTYLPAAPRLGAMRGPGAILGDIVGPVAEDDWWSADDPNLLPKKNE